MPTATSRKRRRNRVDDAPPSNGANAPETPAQWARRMAAEFVYVDQVAAAYGVSPQTLRRELAAGVWPGAKPFDRSTGGHYRKPYRWLRSDVEKDRERRGLK